MDDRYYLIRQDELVVNKYTLEAEFTELLDKLISKIREKKRIPQDKRDILINFLEEQFPNDKFINQVRKSSVDELNKQLQESSADEIKKQVGKSHCIVAETMMIVNCGLID